MTSYNSIYVEDILKFSREVIRDAKEAKESLKTNNIRKAVRLMRRIAKTNYASFLEVRSTSQEKKIIQSLEAINRDVNICIVNIKRNGDTSQVEALLDSIIGIEQHIQEEQHKNDEEQSYLYAGIDMGGTRTRCLLSDKNGAILGKGTFHGSFLGHEGEGFYGLFDAVLGSLKKAIKKAHIEDPIIKRMCISFAGGHNKLNQRKLQTLIMKYCNKQDRRIHLMDVMLHGGPLPSWLGAFNGQDGIIVIAGTGHYVYGRFEGVEKTISDVASREKAVGSGSMIGREGAAAVLKTIKHKKTSPLVKKFREAYKNGRLYPKWRNKYSLVKLLKQSIEVPLEQNFLRLHEISPMGGLVFETANEGDTQAQAIIKKVTKNYTLYILDVAAALNVGDKPCQVAYVGSVIGSTLVRQKIQSELKEKMPNLKLVKPRLAPEEAALEMAIKNIRFY